MCRRVVIFAPMKTIFAVTIVVLAGLVGLALVFTDVVPIRLGLPRILLGAAFYLAVGFGLARLRVDAKPLTWALAAGWGPVLLGIVGLWVSVTDPASGDWGLAVLFLLGPGAAAALGAGVAAKLGRA